MVLAQLERRFAIPVDAILESVHKGDDYDFGSIPREEVENLIAVACRQKNITPQEFWEQFKQEVHEEAVRSRREAHRRGSQFLDKAPLAGFPDDTLLTTVRWNQRIGQVAKIVNCS